MQAAAHGKLNKMRHAGPSPAVAQEFLDKTPHRIKSMFARENPRTGMGHGRNRSHRR